MVILVINGKKFSGSTPEAVLAQIQKRFGFFAGKAA